MAHESSGQTAHSQGRPGRWWPGWVIPLLAGLVVTVVRFQPGISFQQRNIQTVAVCALAVLLWLTWASFFSRLRREIRLALVTGLLTPLLLSACLLRIRGVSGDLLPVLEWRFGQRGRSQDSAVQRPPHPASQSHSGATGGSATNDWPQFLGPSRTGVAQMVPLARDWKLHPPQLMWRRSVGPAWSGFAVQGRLAVTQEQRGDQEVVACYDLPSGKELWMHQDPAHYHTTIAGEGPRSTPAVVGKSVYAMGATGLLNCLDLASGRRIWARDVPKDNQGSVGEWGVSCSPLILGQRVIVTTGAKGGRSLVAYGSEDGQPVWAGGHDQASYSSPVAATLAGAFQVLVFNAKSVGGYDAGTGQVLWEYRWPAGHPHITTPLVLGRNQVLVSSGYGTGSELLQVEHSSTNWTTRRLWKTNRLKSKFANLIEWQGYIYGLDDGILVCLSAATGELRWKEGRYGHGQMIRCGPLLLVMAENGEVALVEPVPEQHRELTRFRALEGKTWNPPALAGPNLLVRNDQEAACFLLPLEMASADVGK